MPVNIDIPLTKSDIIKALDRHATATEGLLLDVAGLHPAYRVHEWRHKVPEEGGLPPAPEHHITYNGYPLAKVMNVKEVTLENGVKVKLERRW